MSEQSGVEELRRFVHTYSYRAANPDLVRAALQQLEAAAASMKKLDTWLYETQGEVYCYFDQAGGARGNYEARLPRNRGLNPDAYGGSLRELIDRLPPPQPRKPAS